MTDQCVEQASSEAMPEIKRRVIAVARVVHHNVLLECGHTVEVAHLTEAEAITCTACSRIAARAPAYLNLADSSDSTKKAVRYDESR